MIHYSFITNTIYLTDYVSVVSSRDAFFTEQMVRNQELKVLRHKLRWCYRREGVNHLENCRFLATQYLEFIKEGMFKPWKTPAPVKE